MTDTINTPEPPLPEPTYAVTVNGVRILTFTDGQMVTYGDARAAHAVAQMQGEPAAWLYDTDMADLAAGKNARVYPVDAKPHYKDTDRVVRLYTAPATAEQPQAREITDAEIDALFESLLGHGISMFAMLRKFARAAIALANGRAET